MADEQDIQTELDAARNETFNILYAILDLQRNLSENESLIRELEAQLPDPDGDRDRRDDR